MGESPTISVSKLSTMQETTCVSFAVNFALCLLKLRVNELQIKAEI